MDHATDDADHTSLHRRDRGPGPTRLTVGCTEDLLAIAPYVLGFHPEDSVVVLSFDGAAGGGPGFHARVDLPMDRDDQRAVADVLTGAVTRNGARIAAVLVYSDDMGAAWSQCELLVARLLELGVEVIDAIRVESDRFYAALSDDLDGTPYDLSSHPLTARLVYDGRVAHASREELAASLVTSEERAVAAVQAALADEPELLAAGQPGPAASAQARWMQRRVRRHLHSRPSRPWSDRDAARVLALVQHVALRDVAWAEMHRGNAAAHVELWRELLRRCPPAWLPAPAALLAFAAWLNGDGALAWCALDECVAVDPDYSLAQRIADLLIAAVPPTRWRQLSDAELPVLRDASPA